MSGSRLLLGAVSVVTAVLVQTAVLARLPLPGGAPDLLLVLVVAFALAEGPVSGTLTGAATGLLADLAGDAELGRQALVLAVVGYAAGLVDGRRRSRLLPLVVVAVAVLGAAVLHLLLGLLVADPRAGLDRSVLATLAYSGVLALLVVPLVAALLRRLDADPFL